MFEKICARMAGRDVQKFEWGEVVWLHEPVDSAERLSAGLVKFFPGRKQSQHVHFGEEQILFAISGRGVHRLNGREEEIREGMLIHCPPFSEHEVINTGKEDLVFLITYTPSKHLQVSSRPHAASTRSLREILDRDELEKLERQVYELLKLNVAMLDGKFRPVVEKTEQDTFWSPAETMKKYESPMFGLDKAYIGRGNVITMIIPILLEDEIVGYLQCGQFLINRDESFEEGLSPVMLEAFREIPLIPKSRLYALQESLEVVGALVSGIIETSARQKVISEKRVRTKLAEGLKNRNIDIGSLLTDEEPDYPLHLEEELAAMIRKLDIEAANRVVAEIMSFCDKRSLPAYEIREIAGEMLIGVTRELYSETAERDIFSAVRYKYREKLKSCSGQGSAGRLLREFSADNISILKSIFLNGKEGLVDKINRYIESNYSQEVTLGNLAETFYISPSYLSSVFNEKNGMSLKDYVNRLRVEKAKQLLRDTDLKISEISRKLGYSQMSYFGSIFRKLEGCTPKEYRAGAKE
ncbi:MAG: Cupin 2 conserved barrel domain protein [Firmicutes bacterium]|nr:Cupin 2 conserved barrel domain protein [Bacillota bacterium]